MSTDRLAASGSTADTRRIWVVDDDRAVRFVLAAALSEERGTLEDVIEPYLIQQGFLVRTARGRMATAKAYSHLGLQPRRDAGLPFPDSEALF